MDKKQKQMKENERKRNADLNLLGADQEPIKAVEKETDRCGFFRDVFIPSDFEKIRKYII